MRKVLHELGAVLQKDMTLNADGIYAFKFEDLTVRDMRLNVADTASVAFSLPLESTWILYHAKCGCGCLVYEMRAEADRVDCLWCLFVQVRPFWLNGVERLRSKCLS